MGVSPCGGGRVAFHVHRQVVRRQPGPAFSFYADMGRRGRRPRGRTPQASALWATRPEGGQADRGTGGCGSIRHPYPRSKGPRPKGGVDPKGPGLSAVPTTPAQAGVTPPLMPFCISGPIFLCCVENTLFAKALLAFRWPTRRFFGGPSVGHVAHIPLEPLSL